MSDQRALVSFSVLFFMAAALYVVSCFLRAYLEENDVLDYRSEVPFVMKIFIIALLVTALMNLARILWNEL